MCEDVIKYVYYVVFILHSYIFTILMYTHMVCAQYLSTYGATCPHVEISLDL